MIYIRLVPAGAACLVLGRKRRNGKSTVKRLRNLPDEKSPNAQSGRKTLNTIIPVAGCQAVGFAGGIAVGGHVTGEGAPVGAGEDGVEFQPIDTIGNAGPSENHIGTGKLR